MTVVEFPKPKLKQRVLNEDEMRAIGVMFWQANILARRTLAGWVLREKQPTYGELLDLASILHGSETSADEIADSPPGDGGTAVRWMNVILEQIEQLDAEDGVVVSRL